MEWGVALNVSETVSTTIDSAVILEEAGFDQIWITDYPSDRYAPVVAAAVAEATTGCKIGLGLLSPYLYPAGHITQMLETLILTYGPRFSVLLGPGDRYALQRVGVKQDRGTIVVERVIETALQVKQFLVERDLQGRVFLGAQGPRMIDASERVDGVLLNYTDLEMARLVTERLRTRKRGFIMGLFPPSHVSPDAQASRESVLFASTMVALGLTRSLQKKFGLSERIGPASRAVQESGRVTKEIIDTVGEDTLHRFGLGVTGPQLCRYMKDAEAYGYDLVVLGPPLCMSSQAVRYAAEARRACVE
ncbi:MAG: LLM class flavin-dependent oxidoreductase [Candidatus Thorarchaeota archaeon]